LLPVGQRQMQVQFVVDMYWCLFCTFMTQLGETSVCYIRYLCNTHVKTESLPFTVYFN